MADLANKMPALATETGRHRANGPPPDTEGIASMPEIEYSARKRCKDCGEDKPASEFERPPKTVCDICRRARQARYSKNYRKRNPDKVAAGDERYRKHNREVKRAVDKRYRERHPERLAARKKRERERDRDRQAERIKRWRKANPERVAELVKSTRRRHPDKHRARAALTRAIKGNAVTKPTHCEECGEETVSFELHGHHEDYSKPLEVEWLCRDCHVERHTS